MLSALSLTLSSHALQVIVGHVAVQVVHQAFDGALGAVGVIVDIADASGHGVGGIRQVVVGALGQFGQRGQLRAELGHTVRSRPEW